MAGGYPRGYVPGILYEFKTKDLQSLHFVSC